MMGLKEGRNAHVYVIWNLKGGVGKTTTTINLAYDFAAKGKKVLLIELDPQVNLTPFFTKANEYQKTIRTLLERPDLIKSSIYRTKYRNIDIIKGSTYIKDSSCYVERFGEIVEQIKKICDYDVVFIDCRTSYEALTYVALSVADTVITPVVLDGYCRDNLAQVSEVVSDLEAEWFVFANKVKRSSAQVKIYQDLLERHAYPFLETCVVERAAVEKALELKKVLLKHAPKNQVTLDFLDLTEELLGKAVE